MKTREQEHDYIKEDVSQRFDWKLILTELKNSNFEDLGDRLERRTYIASSDYIQTVCRELLRDLGYDMSDSNEDAGIFCDDMMIDYQKCISEIAECRIPETWIYAYFEENSLFLAIGRDKED